MSSDNDQRQDSKKGTLLSLLTNTLPPSLPNADTLQPHVILSSSVILSRNFIDFELPSNKNFYRNANDEKTRKIARQIRDELLGEKALKRHLRASVPKKQLQALRARGDIIQEFLDQSSLDRSDQDAVFLDDETLSFLINVNNHVDIIAQRNNATVREVLENLIAKTSKTKLEQFSLYDDDLGYVTTNWDQIGNGLKMMVRLHTPALCIKRRTNQILKAADTFDLTFDVIAEEREPVANALTCVKTRNGRSKHPRQLAERLDTFAKKLEHHEFETRRVLLNDPGQSELKDYIGRAKGVIKYAYKMEREEALHLASTMWFASEIGFAPHEARKEAFAIIARGANPNLAEEQTQTWTDWSKPAAERDAVERAAWVKKLLGNFC